MRQRERYDRRFWRYRDEVDAFWLAFVVGLVICVPIVLIAWL